MTTLDHGMKSIWRVIRNLRNEDEKKQEAICFILGQKMEIEPMVVARRSMDDKLAGGDNYQYHKLMDVDSDNRSFTWCLWFLLCYWEIMGVLRGEWSEVGGKDFDGEEG